MGTYKRMIVEKTGAPEAMHLVDVPVVSPGLGEVRIRHEAIGVDFIDTQIRGGLLPATLPTGLGFAGVGIAVEVGPGVDHVNVGERVAYMYFVAGSYAEERIVPADRVVVLPDQTMAPDLAAGALFRGLTAWYLATRLRRTEPGDVVLVHAAAGGVGLILVQWLAHLGATVVGTVDSPEKAAVASEYGCHHVVAIPGGDFAAEVRAVSGGKGAQIVFDCIGSATIEGSLDSAARFGLIVSFGWPSGDPDVPLMTLRNKGSLFVTRPTVTQYTADADDLKHGVDALFGLIAEGALRIRVGHTYALADAAKAHADLSAGRTTGSLVLVP
ncbi:quinone oxidoreductase [Xanthobacter agilis]